MSNRLSKVKYKIHDHKQFAKDMKKAGLKVELYHGRNFWHGPSVKVNNIQDALSGTKIPCQWDNMGLGWVVYPKSTDPSLNHESENDDGDEN